MYALILFLLLMTAVIVFSFKTRPTTGLKFLMDNKIREIIVELRRNKIIGVDNIIKRHTKINNNCIFEGQIPKPIDFTLMPLDILQDLFDCGAMKSVLNYWVILMWLSLPPSDRTVESLLRGFACTSDITPLSDPFRLTNFEGILNGCLLTEFIDESAVGTLKFFMDRAINQIIAELKRSNITGVDNLIKQHTHINTSCSYEGQIPTPGEFTTMSKPILQHLFDCGAMTSVLNYWVVVIWLTLPSVLRTRQSLLRGFTCTMEITPTSDPFRLTNFDGITNGCLLSEEVIQ